MILMKAKLTSRTVRRISWLLFPLLITLTLLRLTIGGTAALASFPPEPVQVGPQAVSAGTWGAFQPQGWVTATPFTATITVTDTQGLLTPTAEFRTSTNGGGAWANWSQTGLTATAGVSTTTYFTVTGLSLGDAATQNQIQFRITNTLGVSDTSTGYTVKIDTADPSSNVAVPVDGQAYKTSPTINGTASDNTSGVQSVAVSIKRTNDNKFWDSSAWVVTETWLSTTGTGSWAKSTGLPSWTDGVTYSVRSRATDVAGHIEAPGGGSTFLFDSSAPAAPISLAASPAGWTNADNFNVSWTNPADVSGIVGAYYKLDSTPASGTDGTFVSGTNITQTSVAVGTDGAHAIYVWLKDRAGNVDHTQRSTTTLHLDTTAPTNPTTLSSSSHVTATWSSDNTVDASWAGAADGSGSGVAGYAIAWDTSAGTIPPASQTTTGTTSTSGVLSDGNSHYLHVRTQDGASNWAGGAAHLGPFYIDATPPAAPTALSASPAGWTHTNSFALQWGNPSDTSGIAGAYYKLDSAPAGPTDGTLVSGTGITSTSGLSVSGDGAHTLYLWLVDEAGNTNEANRITTSLKLDTTDPSVPVITGGDPSGWSNRNAFTVTWQTPADMSGIAGAYYKFDAAPASDNDGTFAAALNQITGMTVPGEGKHSIYLWLLDNAGNVNYAHRYYSADLFWYDATPPSTTPALDGTLGQNGWYTSSVTTTLTATDQAGLSGVAETRYQVDNGGWQTGNSFTTSGEGVHQADFYSSDVAGNSEISHTIGISIDLTAPDVTYTTTGSLGNNGWFTSSVTVTLSPTDATSGVAQTKHRLDGGSWQTGTSLLVSAPGTHTFDYYAVDQAGNVGSVLTAALKLDLAPPSTTYTISGTAGTDGWYSSDPVTITLVATDSTSGPAQTFYTTASGMSVQSTNAWNAGSVFTVTGEGTHTFQFYSTDAAGNAEPVQSGGVKIDITAPGVPINPIADPPGWANTDSFTITWSNPADLSGVVGAYYKLNSPPTSPTDGILVTTTNAITGVSVGTEGRHDLFLWLQDRAGNVDQANKNAIPKAFSYDSTVPVTTDALSGTLGENDWYVSPVTITFDALDSRSGVAETDFRVGTAPTQTGTSLVLATDDKHTVRYWSVDVAGNVETPHSRTIRVDRTAPQAPVNPQISPVGWGGGPCFSVGWSVPPDTSGIQGIYYKFDTPPASDSGGTYVATTDSLPCILPATEGKHDLHLWLKDNAGNVDFHQRADLADAVWYDASPPSTTLHITGTLGSVGWYRSAVTVTLTSTDTASGVTATHFRIDNGPWQLGNALVVPSDGVHPFDFYADDNATNVEPVQHTVIHVDKTNPSTAVNALPNTQLSTTFAVSWSGNDNAGGSGIAHYDVQSKDGIAGTWQDWLTGVGATSAQFTGQRGHVYYFRSRGMDVAGNQEDYPTGDQVPFTYIQSFFNGDFELGSFSGWVQGGGIGRGVVEGDGHALAASTTWMALLGDPSYGSGAQGNVPPNTSAFIYQEIQVPLITDLPVPLLSFWYRVYTYDVVYGCPPGQTDPQNPNRCKVDPDFLYDSFDVRVEGDGFDNLVFRGGNFDRSKVGTLVDTGWQHATIDLSPYAGQTIRVRFANWNRPDSYYNTWTYLDDAWVVSPGRAAFQFYLPIIMREPSSVTAQTRPPQPPAPGQPTVSPGPRR
ncbi:MAG: hypothetical protein GXP41_02660 [Chloroflexi bacterium]|nr:hypothetical protein [Chloroflexota bacterium]